MTGTCAFMRQKKRKFCRVFGASFVYGRASVGLCRKKCAKPIDNIVKRDIMISSFFASVLPRPAVVFSSVGRTDKGCLFLRKKRFLGAGIHPACK